MRVAIAWPAIIILLLVVSVREANAQDFSAIVAKSRSSVVLVLVEQNDSRFVSGTGFLVAGSSAIVTAAHVVRDVKAMVVKYADGSAADAKPILIWRESDVALVQPTKKAPANGLPGRASPLRVGQPVIAIGYPVAEKLGVSQFSVTQGIVSAIRLDVFQLNVTVNPGNSGGPVLDSSGAVIGVVSGTLTGTGLAIASPWRDVKTALESHARGIVPVAVRLGDSDESVTGWIEHGVVLMDAGLLANLLKGSVFWDPQTRTLSLVIGDKRMRFVPGSPIMGVDGQRIPLPLPMRQDRRIPLRPVVVVLGGSLRLNADSFEVRVALPGTAR